MWAPEPHTLGDTGLPPCESHLPGPRLPGPVPRPRRRRDHVGAQQADLVADGKFDDAFMAGVEEVQQKFPDGKYDDAILEAIDSLPD